MSKTHWKVQLLCECSDPHIQTHFAAENVPLLRRAVGFEDLMPHLYVGLLLDIEDDTDAELVR